jgi:lipopolysaccharide/colanic/teichoic acid biosynthesis glycosyltransferase
MSSAAERLKHHRAPVNAVTAEAAAPPHAGVFGDAASQPEPLVQDTLNPILRKLDRAAKRIFDFVVSGLLLAILAVPILVIVVLIKLDSPGPAFFRCARVGYRGRTLWMLKFRKMYDGAGGKALTTEDDSRFTRMGGWLANAKLDELPQLWHVLRGEMSLVGPRPEDQAFVDEHAAAYEEILSVRPGMTGYSQLAFAEEGKVLDEDDPIGHYLDRLLPQKVLMDQMYAAQATIWTDVKILAWTAAAVLLRREVAVHRETGKLGLRRR